MSRRRKAARAAAIRRCQGLGSGPDPDLTIDELTAQLAAEHGLTVHRPSVGRLLHRLDCHTKKDLQALEQKRKDVVDLRRIWIGKRQPFMARHLERLAFIDETSVKTNMAKTTGWAPRGQRLIDHVPPAVVQLVFDDHMSGLCIEGKQVQTLLRAIEPRKPFLDDKQLLTKSFRWIRDQFL